MQLLMGIVSRIVACCSVLSSSLSSQSCANYADLSSRISNCIMFTWLKNLFLRS
jgi:hypothetical protein